jgi:ferredoxin
MKAKKPPIVAPVNSPYYPGDVPVCLYCGKSACIVCGRCSQQCEIRTLNQEWNVDEPVEPLEVTFDRFSRLAWCEDCDHRRRALVWLSRHNWPHVDTGRFEMVGMVGWIHLLLLERREYADGAGQTFVDTAGKLLFPDFRDQPTNDELIWLLLAYIEAQEDEEASAS